ncbi:hypothetical protein ACHQM5_010842 [Ranunculus cassubicifolius]
MGLPLLKKCRYSDRLGRLPEEVLMEIMLNLRAGDLQNLKSVSKFWNSFVSNPDFVKIHFNHSQSHHQHQILFKTLQIIADPLNQPRYEHHHFGINTNNMHRKVDFHIGSDKVLALKASCDGLLLLQDQHCPKQLYISNPVTAQFEPLPLFDTLCNDWALVCDTRIQKYKVFAVRCKYLYTLLTLGERTPSWQHYDNQVRKMRSGFNLLSNVLLLNKELHWLTPEVEGLYSSSGTQLYYFIFSIHVEEYGKFTKTRVPLRLCRQELYALVKCEAKHLLSDVNGSLCLTFVSHNLLKVFMLEDRDGGIWTKSHVVRLQSLPKHSILFHTFMSEDLCLVAMGGVGRSNLADLIKVLVHVEDKLFWYDLKTQEKTLVGLLSKDHKLHRSYFFHLESLVTWDTGNAS